MTFCYHGRSIIFLVFWGMTPCRLVGRNLLAPQFFWKM